MYGRIYPMKPKGALQVLILQVLSLGPAHGYAIAKDIKAKSKGVLEYREGTLYPTLHDLEHRGLVESSERTESGRVRRYYRLTKSGRAVLAEEREQWLEFSEAVRLILKEA